MAIDLTPEQKDIGKANFQRVVGSYLDPKGKVSRRDFMKGTLAAGAVVPVSAAAYFGYQSATHFDKPVKAALIGAGDEGGVLVGEHNDKYVQFVAVCDIRPSNIDRIFKGQPNSPRKGFEKMYGKDARKNIQVFESYQKMLQDRPDIEMVVIALPLNLHAPVAIDCMNFGKQRGKPLHVLCEKLMAWNITQCKEMIRVADATDSILSIGHQRHYSLLYAHALEVMKSDILGDIRHIRALWHRNNSLPRKDDKGNILTDPKTGDPVLADSWHPEIKEEDRKALEGRVKEFGFKSLEELVRWRLFWRTGGGLMAELGSHQLDACSIFLGKVKPLCVSGTGTKSFYREQYKRGEREVPDHVFVTYEFPGKNYWADADKGQGKKDEDDVVVVTYSSINTNTMEGYGEHIMGNKGSLIVHQEADVMLYPERGAASRATAVTVTSGAGGAPVLDTSGTTGAPAAAAVAAGQASLGSGPPSKGYREEMEHFAYCVRMWGEGASKQDRAVPRCHGRVAMADAIIALTANLAMKKHERIEFKKEWFDAASPEVPDADVKVEPI
jgi:predicted dehydrogenase